MLRKLGLLFLRNTVRRLRHRQLLLQRLDRGLESLASTRLFEVCANLLQSVFELRGLLSVLLLLLGNLKGFGLKLLHRLLLAEQVCVELAHLRALLLQILLLRRKHLFSGLEQNLVVGQRVFFALQLV